MTADPAGSRTRAGNTSPLARASPGTGGPVRGSRVTAPPGTGSHVTAPVVTGRPATAGAGRPVPPAPPRTAATGTWRATGGDGRCPPEMLPAARTPRGHGRYPAAPPAAPRPRRTWADAARSAASGVSPARCAPGRRRSVAVRSPGPAPRSSPRPGNAPAGPARSPDGPTRSVPGVRPHHPAALTAPPGTNGHPAAVARVPALTTVTRRRSHRRAAGRASGPRQACVDCRRCRTPADRAPPGTGKPRRVRCGADGGRARP